MQFIRENSKQMLVRVRICFFFPHPNLFEGDLHFSVNVAREINKQGRKHLRMCSYRKIINIECYDGAESVTTYKICLRVLIRMKKDHQIVTAIGYKQS